ncbi:MAG: hypothetical protein K2H08_01275 [Duncaniella sp.]|nr:hypothetical protein [Duncaniella sp.]
MKTLNKLTAAVMAGLMLISGVTFTSCNDDDDDFSTQQYVGGVTLNVFGPSPVARGGELRFLGSGMKQIQSVTIPGAGDITDINVISDNEIRITVPQNAEPGHVVLHSPKGDITTKTILTFTEPISIEKLSPLSVKPGDELTITGDYLNLISEVIFADDVTVDKKDFTSHSRYEIKLAVPAEAQTGKIILSDGAEIPNWIYSEDELSVVLPSAETVVDLSAAKPGDVVKVKGVNLDLVEKVVMPNGDEVEFTINGDELSFVLPENASDGAVCMIPASGVKVVIATIGLAEPTDLVAVPATELRAGNTIVISGKNLEVVSEIIFPGADAATDFTLKADNSIEVVMPAEAVTGDVVLNLLSGKSVTLPISTAKPGDIAYSVASIPVGDMLTVTGKNLDVVARVDFIGGVSAVPESATSGELTVIVPTTAETGALTFVMANGESVEGPSLEMSFPSCAWLTAVPEKFVKGQIYTLSISNADRLTEVMLNGAKAQYICNASAGELTIQIPSGLEGIYELKLISDNGEIAYDIRIVPAETIAYEGPTMLTWGDDGRFGIDMSFFKEAKPGDKLKLYFTQNDNWGQVQFNNGAWGNGSMNFPEIGGAYLNTDNVGGKDVTEYSLTLTEEVLNDILSNPGDYFGLNSSYNVTGVSGMVIQGSDWKVEKIVFIYN